ncbi:stage III sporulation protein AF [Clostridium fermenticellae]|uniref:Stage III sporulation protein AF n=1 Tax=Clostridium fermenticellae TaxID=2068654 RepID=A0A386H4K7_9CLOT|nr:stage III sporulation protein AF [Clostridium fermenticellae]AYD40596.1 stage III sporulation protein AF [Clostridium fermenticellae]
MIQALRNWIITICTAVFFITAVEMILPDNSLKKYAKFVLGLIMITVFINPVIKLFNNDINIDSYVNTAVQNFDSDNYKSDFNEYKQKSINEMMENFKLNLQNSCEEKLKEKYPNQTYKINVDACMDNDNEKVTIKDLKVGVKDGSVEKIKNISINIGSKSVESKTSDGKIDQNKAAEIKKYLSDELNISTNVIQVYKI